MYDPGQAAQRIFDKRAAGATFEPASDWYGPTFDLDAAYDIQDAYVDRLRRQKGVGVCGYKIGLTSLRMQNMCGADAPISGVVLADGLQQSPGRVEASRYLRLGAEFELAVRIGVDLETSIPTRDTVSQAIDQFAAAIEIVDDANADYSRLNGASIAADNSWNAGLVIAPATAYAQNSLKGRQGVLYRNGEKIDEGSSDDVLGDPLDVVVWLAKHLAERNHSLKAGDWVSTGSIVTTKFAQPGETYRFELEGLAPVQLEVF